MLEILNGIHSCVLLETKSQGEKLSRRERRQIHGFLWLIIYDHLGLNLIPNFPWVQWFFLH